MNIILPFGILEKTENEMSISIYIPLIMVLYLILIHVHWFWRIFPMSISIDHGWRRGPASGSDSRQPSSTGGTQRAWMTWKQNIWESAGKSPRTEAFHGKIIYSYSIILNYIHLSMEKNLPFPQISTCDCGEPIASLRSFIVSPGTVTQPLLSPRQVPGTDSEPPGRFRSTRGLGEVPGTQLGPTWG